MTVAFADNSQEVLTEMHAAAIRVLEKRGLMTEGYWNEERSRN